LLCGNGGSAADAQHLAAEMLVRLRPDVNRDGVPAIALAMDPSSMTACGNDYSFEVYFERMTRALGRPGDVLIGITTSGKSPNVIKAMQAARQIGMTTLGLLGGNGGPALAECDMALVVPSTETGRIQEGHIAIGHALMELIEDGLIAREAIKRC
jgi:D-sedoheptulose 7-phosphate isomerase